VEPRLKPEVKRKTHSDFKNQNPSFEMFLRLLSMMGLLLNVGKVGGGVLDNRRNGLSRIGRGEGGECRQYRDDESEIRVSLTS
jgi:hypothetical protein